MITEAIYEGKRAREIAGTKYPYGYGWHNEEVELIERVVLRGRDASTLIPEWCECSGFDKHGTLIRRQKYEGKKPWDQKAHEAKIYAR
jgi:hypothetical protein